ncbi:DUF945 domain-containing protein [bacterium]|nr:DUF945 domain-containing protein [bacterium]
MSNRTQQFSDPFVPVSSVPLTTPDGRSTSRMAVMIEQDGEQVEAGVVSNSYSLVTNEEVHQIARDVLARADLHFEDGGHIFDGKRYRQRWVLPSLEVMPRVGDFVHITLDALNSYDGSTLFGLAFNAQRLVCSNGMMVDFMLGGFKFKHLGDDQFYQEMEFAASKVMNVADQLEPLSENLKELVETPMRRNDIQRVFSDLKTPKSLMAETYMAIEEDNAWGVLNAFTDVLTRQRTHSADNRNRQLIKYLMQN